MALSTRKDLIRDYNQFMASIDDEATQDADRAYGGVVRSSKGKFVEYLAEQVVGIAWQETGGDPDRLTIGDQRTFRIKVHPDYVENLPPEIKRSIGKNWTNYFYRAQVDKHVFIDGKFQMGVECKAYTENAMLKRILVDFHLIKTLHPELICCLLQLESHLGGEYSRPLASPQTGSKSSHTLMSYFPEVELNILTLLEGERHVKKPIHKPEFRKELKPAILDHAIKQFSDLLIPFT